jgi:HK97 gp10 family phage protein
MSQVIIKINGDALLGVEKGNQRGLTESAIFVTNQAKALAPVDLGQGRNSVMYKEADGTDGGFNDSSGKQADNKLTSTPKAGSALVGTNLLYMLYQEFGTRYMNAQPWLRPAGELLKIDIPAKQNEIEMEKALKKGVKVIKFSNVKAS